MTVPQRGAKASGGTAFAATTTIKSAEVNTDFDTVYNLLDGGLGDDQFGAGSIDFTKIGGTISTGDIDDHSATAAERASLDDPGDASSPSLATDLQEEIQQLRYQIQSLTTGQGTQRRDTSGSPTDEDVDWTEDPVRGINRVLNGNFHIYTGTDPAAPDHWTLTGTPTTIELVGSQTVEGAELVCHMVADAAEGITQDVAGLKASTRYLLTVEARVAAGDTVNLTTAASDGTTWSDVAGTFTETDMTTKSWVVVTDSTPTDLTISFAATASADEIWVKNVALRELADEPIQEESGGYTTQAVLSAAHSVTAAWADVTDLEVVVICPGPGYEIIVEADCTLDAVGGGTEVGIRIAENGAVKRTAAERVGYSTTEWAASMSSKYVNESPTAGTTYTYKVQVIGSTASADVSPNAASVGQTDSTLTVSVRRRG